MLLRDGDFRKTGLSVVIGKIPQLRIIALFAAVGIGCTTGCASKAPEAKQKDEFFTSGNPEADQRARAIEDNSQKGATEKKQNAKHSSDSSNPPAEVKQTLYERLGGEQGITTIVDDFLKRAMKDPRVNWSRQGVKTGGWFRRNHSVTWNASPQNVAQLKKHFVQFISLASGGPVKYDGKPIKSTHAEMKITKPEFDAAIGDLKATLDKLSITPELQKEVLALFESTRPEIVPKS
jgi:hemoglobin